jgi:hypothetical protein
MSDNRLSVRDEAGTLREIFARIGARVVTGGGISDGVRYAASFTDGATRNDLEPLDWDDCTLAELRVLAVHGYDFRVRAEALHRVEERIKNLTTQGA